MNSQPEWVPKSLMSPFEDEIKRASELLASAGRKNITISQRRSRVQTELSAAARTGYAAIESTLRMAAAQILVEKTELSSDTRQQILETARGYFSLPNTLASVAASMERKTDMPLAAVGGALCGLALAAVLADIKGEKFTWFAVAGTVCITAAVGAVVHEAVWRSKSQRLAEERLAILPGHLGDHYRAYAKEAIDKYIVMIEANLKKWPKARVED